MVLGVVLWRTQINPGALAGTLSSFLVPACTLCLFRRLLPRRILARIRRRTLLCRGNAHQRQRDYYTQPCTHIDILQPLYSRPKAFILARLFDPRAAHMLVLSCVLTGGSAARNPSKVAFPHPARLCVESCPHPH